MRYIVDSSAMFIVELFVVRRVDLMVAFMYVLGLVICFGFVLVLVQWVVLVSVSDFNFVVVILKLSGFLLFR